MSKKLFFVLTLILTLGFSQLSASCSSYGYNDYMGTEEIPYGGSSTGYGYGSFTMYDSEGAKEAGVPEGYSGYVLKVVDSGAQQLGFSVDLSNYLAADVKAIKFRIYCEGTSSTSVRLSGDNCASFALNSAPTALNEWIEVAYDGIAYLADLNGYIKNFHFGLRKGTVLYIDSITVVESEKISKNLASGKSVTLTGYSYDGYGNKSDIKTSTINTATDCSIDNYTSISGAFHLDAEIDLGSVQYISEVKIYRRMKYLGDGANSDAKMRVEVSNDGEEWSSLGIMEKVGDNATEENTTTYQVLTINSVATQARYIRFVGQNIHNGTQTSFSEIAVFSGDANLASGKSVILTGYSYDGYGKKSDITTVTNETITDGDKEKYTSISGVFHLDAEIDLGSVQYISGAKIYRKMIYLVGGANSDAKMRVEVSTDGEEWSSLGIMEKDGDNATEENTTAYQILTINSAATQARYIRFVGQNIHNGTVSSISEIEVFPGDANLASGKSVILTGYSYDGYGKKSNIATVMNETLTDGDTETYTSISGAFHLDAEIDLGSVQYISGVKIYRRMKYLVGGANSNARMRVEVSNDGEEWSSLGIMEKDGDNATEENTTTYQVLTITFDLAEARYIRFVGQDIHNGTVSSISEIEVAQGIQTETEPPVIALVNDEFYVPVGTKIRFDQIATDNSGEVNVKYEWSDGAVGRGGKLLEGVHTLTITATDLYFNCSEKTVVFNVSKYDVTLTRETVSLNNATSECRLFVVCYDKDNALIDVVCVDNAVNNVTYDITEIPSQTRLMKAFVWDDNNCPLNASQVLTIGDL